MGMNILLLEDDFTLSKEVSYFFESKSIQCDRVYDGSLLLQQFKLKPYDAIVLDINVPGKNGLDVCHSLRLTDPKVPILMLSAFGEIDEKLTAFNNGADDYMVKPFHLEELLARVNSLLRRKDILHQKNNTYTIADLNIDIDNKEVTRAGTVINLTPKEFKLLVILAQAGGKILSKQEIADKLWDYYIETNQNTIEVYINFLRNKIDKNHEIKLIHTKAGFGYYLKELTN
jgi:DNA-binding response OmpR family regulator